MSQVPSVFIHHDKEWSQDICPEDGHIPLQHVPLSLRLPTIYHTQPEIAVDIGISPLFLDMGTICRSLLRSPTQQNVTEVVEVACKHGLVQAIQLQIVKGQTEADNGTYPQGLIRQPSSTIGQFRPTFYLLARCPRES